MSGSDRSDMVNMPSHYIGRGGLEARRVIEDAGLSAGFYLGNAIKYVLRAGKKHADAVQDLKKAKRNLEMLAEAAVAGEALSNGRKRALPTGLIAEAFDLPERLALVVAVLTMPRLVVAEIGMAQQLLAEEIDHRIGTAIWPAAHRVSA